MNTQTHTQRINGSTRTTKVVGMWGMYRYLKRIQYNIHYPEWSRRCWSRKHIFTRKLCYRSTAYSIRNCLSISPYLYAITAIGKFAIRYSVRFRFPVRYRFPSEPITLYPSCKHSGMTGPVSGLSAWPTFLYSHTPIVRLTMTSYHTSPRRHTGHLIASGCQGYEIISL